MGILPLSTKQIDSSVTIKTHKDDILGKRTFRFDFEKNEFITDVMNQVRMTTSDNERLEQVVEKILHDRRYNQDDPFEIISCELKRVYTEALIYHPFIESVSDFLISNDNDKITCEFVVHGVNGTTVQRVEELRNVNI